MSHNTATHCNTLQRTATHRMNAWQSGESRCTTFDKSCKHRSRGTNPNSILVTNEFFMKRYSPQHTATYCNALPHSATSVSWDEPELYFCHKRILHEKAHSPQHSETKQSITAHCNILQHTATHRNIPRHTATHCNTLQRTATHCNTLQHSATRCNTLQHAATRCNTLST